MKLTQRQLEALRVIASHQPVRGREFAVAFWPDHPTMHVKSLSRAGRSQPGAVSSLSGGSYLGKLRKLGLVEWTPQGYILSRQGIEEVRKRWSWANE